MLSVVFKSSRVLAIALWSLSSLQIAWAHSSSKQHETPHLEFVTEFVRELAEVQDIRDNFDREMSETKEPNSLSISSYSFTRMTLELKSQMGVLGSMHLNKPFDFLIPSIVELYREKMNIFQQLLEIDRTMLQGPKDGVDYSKLASEMPELRAKLDDADHALFKASPAVFLTLVDPKPDSHGHASHLIITRGERAELVEYINTSFGNRLNQKNQPYGVSIAIVMRDALLEKGYRCSDEPWD